MVPPEIDTTRLRPFRAAAYGVHLTVTVAFCLLITWNVVRSVLAMTPALPPQPVQLAPVAQCAWRGEKLWEALEEARRGLGEARGGVRAAHEHWESFRTEWVKNLRIAQAECGVGQRDRVQLRELFGDLERLEDLYTTHAVQYVGEIGPAVEQLRHDLGRAEQGH